MGVGDVGYPGPSRRRTAPGTASAASTTRLLLLGRATDVAQDRRDLGTVGGSAVDGRPHWGKLHVLGADRLAELYPRFEDFGAVRRAHDPTGLFTNDYTDRVLGPVG